VLPYPDNEAIVGEPRLRVRYAETDKMGVVYNSNYLIRFEIGRVELMRDLGHSYREVEEDGYLLPVAEVTCRYKGSAAYDDEIVIHTSVLKLRRSLIRFGYQVVRESDSTLLATGASAHFVVGRDKKRRPLSEKYMVPFARAMTGVANLTASSE